MEGMGGLPHPAGSGEPAGRAVGFDRRAHRFEGRGREVCLQPHEEHALLVPDVIVQQAREVLHCRGDVFTGGDGRLQVGGEPADLAVLLADAVRAGGIDCLRGGKDRDLLVGHVTLELGVTEVEESARGGRLARAAAEAEGLDQPLVVVARQGDESGRAIEASGTHGPV
jgi:hypothetical protein